MSPDEKSLNRLSALADTLNSKTDELNTILTELEERFESMKLGVTVWLDEPIDETQQTDSSTISYRVGYTKIDSHWRIATKRIRKSYMYHDGDPECPYEDLETLSNPVPLTNSPRSVRVQGAALLDELIEELVQRVHTFIENIDSAKKAVESE